MNKTYTLTEKQIGEIMDVLASLTIAVNYANYGKDTLLEIAREGSKVYDKTLEIMDAQEADW